MQSEKMDDERNLLNAQKRNDIEVLVEKKNKYA